ncbi:MAG: NAD(P)-dependent oxidoreductase [Trichloromonas sp.]|jgi:precorrin-2 dehydrogenase/sirohydrochlorin ferrochelatase|nr:NAD(P)-dependent oxidoreductase [Trichloromonas sp.]
MTTDTAESAQRAFYPLHLDLTGRLCVVVGGGAVGRRKLAGLSRAGARVRVIDADPASVPPTDDTLEFLPRPYRDGDLEGAFLAFAATADPAVNAAVAAEARRRGIPVNRADDGSDSDFILPANLRREDLLFTVAGGGRSPALAVLLRDRLAEHFGPEWATVLDIAAALRRKRLTPLKKTKYNQEILRQLLAAGLAERVAAGDAAGVDGLLAALPEGGCTLDDLGIQLPKGMP